MITVVKRLQIQASVLFRPSLFLLLSILCLSACSSGWDSVGAKGETMGTYYHVQVAGPKSSLPASNQVRRWTDEFFKEFNQSMSTYIEDSEISQINRAQHSDWIPVSEGMWRVLQLSQKVSEQSEGAFDITVMPLVNLWGFGPQAQVDSIPTDEQLEQALERVGYQKLELDAERRAVRKPEYLTLDLSAVAKGFGADELADHLVSKGYMNVLVEIGGDLAMRGLNARQTPWRIGIESPSYGLLSGGGQLVQALELTDGGMTTSGDYRNYFEVDGTRFSHTIDPATGRPVDHNTASVTVVADTSAEADAWATALNVPNLERAMALAEQHQVAAYFIVREDDAFNTYFSEAFRPYLEDKTPDSSDVEH